MFKLEKEMLPILTQKLSEKYRTDFCVNEFNSGNGIADLVFAVGVDSLNDNTLVDYKLIHIIMNYLNRKNKIIEAGSFFRDLFLSKKQVFNLIEALVEIGVLEKIDNETFIVKNKYSPPVKRIISIEVKLRDWKNGFYQALRYKTYSHKSYLAISEEFAHRVDINLLKEYNIGLISVTPNNIRFIFDIKEQLPNNKVAHAYLSQKIAYHFNQTYYGLCDFVTSPVSSMAI
ncbi:MAG: hypothetical protein WC770_09560 [Phycisphaerae bacterium]|jgi:hypothetical protein